MLSNPVHGFVTEVAVVLEGTAHTKGSDITGEHGCWEIASNAVFMKTWARVEYSEDRNDGLILVKDGVVYIPFIKEEIMSTAV